MKKIGILGGMGPEATILFYNKIIQNTPSKKDQDHIQTLIYSNPKIPDRTQSIQSDNHGPIQQALQESAKVLERGGADFIVIPCNTAHFWHEVVQEAVSIPVLHMIHELGQQLQEKNCSSVGLLATIGTVQTNLYQRCFKDHDIEVCIPSEEDQKHVMDAITEVKSGQKSPETIEALNRIMSQLPTDTIILGCTELPILIQTNDTIVDPMDSLVSQAIKKALSE